MNLRKLAFAILVIVSAFFFSHGFMNAETVPSNYGFDVSINPEATNPGVFQAKLVISELASGKVVAAPTIRFRAGQAAETTVGETKDGINFKFLVSVDQKGSVAEYTAVVLDSTTEVSRSQAKITLGN
ncbi:hypothetical protein L0152_05010 [bacterium]|nr:hypothetical protein [bacterium]